MLYDSGPGVQRIIIFTTRKNLDLMVNTQHWFADGTFKSTPPLFQQLYTIHGIKYNAVVPTVYILMSNRTERTYLTAFNQLKVLEPRLNPLSIMTDFELAAINAFKIVFPAVNQRGCFFHFKQYIFRRVQALGLAEQYMNDGTFAHQIKMLGSLAFVPEAEVLDAFEQLGNTEFYRDNEEAIPLLDYFEETWIGMVRRGRRRPPKFSISLWNCYEGVREDLPKTNNSVEGWHNEFSSLIGANHPSIWKFIEGLQKQQSINEMKIIQYLSGRNEDEGRRTYRDVAKRILNIVNDYPNLAILDYLNNLAHNFNLTI